MPSLLVRAAALLPRVTLEAKTALPKDTQPCSCPTALTQSGGSRERRLASSEREVDWIKGAG